MYIKIKVRITTSFTVEFNLKLHNLVTVNFAVKLTVS